MFAFFLAAKGNRSELALIAVSLAAALALAAVVYQRAFPQKETKTYFRPDDMYWGGPRPNTFKPGIDVLFPMPHGDLGTRIPRSLVQPRTVRFKTDTLGWRNDASYAGQQVVVIGDSFVVGTGNSQEETLANTLTSQFGLPAYNASYPLDPQNYFDIGLDFLKQTGADADMYMFVFEGNDFVCGDCFGPKDAISPSPYSALKFSVAYRLGKTAAFFPFLVNYWSSLDAELSGRAISNVLIGKAGGKRLAFLSYYVGVTSCTTLGLIIDRPHPEVLAHLKAVFFVPTKYRVYQPLLDDQIAAPPVEPSVGVAALQDFFGKRGIPVVDLTPALRDAAKTSLGQGKFIYWIDDTHWNHEAIQVAAKAVIAIRGR